MVEIFQDQYQAGSSKGLMISSFLFNLLDKVSVVLIRMSFMSSLAFVMVVLQIILTLSTDTP